MHAIDARASSCASWRNAGQTCELRVAPASPTSMLPAEQCAARSRRGPDADVRAGARRRAHAQAVNVSARPRAARVRVREEDGQRVQRQQWQTQSQRRVEAASAATTGTSTFERSRPAPPASTCSANRASRQRAVAFNFAADRSRRRSSSLTCRSAHPLQTRTVGALQAAAAGLVLQQLTRRRRKGREGRKM